MYSSCFYCNKQLRRSVALMIGDYYHCSSCNVQQIHDPEDKSKLVHCIFEIDNYRIDINHKRNKSTITFNGKSSTIDGTLKVTPSTSVSKIKTYLLFT